MSLVWRTNEFRQIDELALQKKVKSQVPSSVTGAEYSSTIRKLWHALYAEMSKHGVHVLRDVADYELTTGDSIEFLDWIENNGHLELAIQCAFELWPKE